MEIARLGTPAGLIATSAFQALALSELSALGVSGIPLLVIDHPLGGERPEAVGRRAQQALEQLAAAIGAAGVATPAAMVGEAPEPPASLELDPDDVYDEFTRRRWADGLPVVAPTAARVRALLGGRDGATPLGAMPPRWGLATLEKLAVNAVMAGCEAALFPIVVAAVEAMLDPAFNLYGVQATTHPVAPLVIVHGPYGRAHGVHSGAGCFGPGFRANATIGRAVRLILMNVGGAWPGRHDMATQGSPAKFSYCIAEDVETSPWGPWCAEDAVTVFGGEAPHNVNDHVSTTAGGILTTLSDTAVTLGSNVGWYVAQSQLLVVLGPEHARTIAADGMTRSDVQRFVYEHARQPLGRMRLGGMWGMHDWPRWMECSQDPEVRLPRVASPDDVLVVVAGGSGKHSAVVPNCTFSRAVRRGVGARPLPTDGANRH